ncbi:MAG: DUF1887 family protein [Bacteroidaceae bacterium]|nr:DUF1887 family protein [Bacteroidaceae bacterium]
MKVHITLVGGQIRPVYRTINAISPDYIVYICSSKTKKDISHIKKFLKADIECEEIELSPTEPLEIKDMAERLANKFANDDVTVNISSGLKSWSYFFGLAFSKQSNFAVLYIDQNNILYNYNTFTSETVESDILDDIPIASYVDFNTYTPEDTAVALEIESLRRFDYKIFNELTIQNPNKNKAALSAKEGTIVSAISPSFVKWRKPNDENVNCEIQFCIENKKGKIEKTLSSPHAFDLSFSTGWFEYKVARMMNRWNMAKRVLMNCRFRSLENKEKNEVDIIVDAGKKAVFVECKTQIFNSTDIDKFNSVIKNYGGNGCKGIFITEAPMQSINIEKCNDHNLLNFSLKSQNNAESKLFFLLNTKLNEINT